MQQDRSKRHAGRTRGSPERPPAAPAGHLLALDADVPHAVEALEEGAFLLTIGWRGRGEA